MDFTLELQDYNGTHRTVSFSNDHLPDIVAEFELFLKGAGFVFDELEVHIGLEDNSAYNYDVEKETVDHLLKQNERYVKEQQVREYEKQHAIHVERLNKALHHCFDEETAGPILHGQGHKR